MSRKEKYRSKKIARRINYIKSILTLSLCLSITIIAFSSLSKDTYSWFSASKSVSGEFRNATQNELISIVENDVEFTNKCKATKKILVKNITTDIPVDLAINGVTYNLSPNETITHIEKLTNNCGDFGIKDIKIIGYAYYFTHTINVDLTKTKLCPPSSDNGQGANFPNNNGMKCGNSSNGNNPGEKKDKKMKR